MPDYNFTITVPANKSKDDPVVVEMVLTKGVLAGGQMYFPAGCHDLVHVTINDGKGQLYPANAEDTYHGNKIAFPLVGRYVLDSVPYKLYARAWSPTTIYQHKIQVTLSVLPEEQVTPFAIIQDLVMIFKRMLGIK